MSRHHHSRLLYLYEQIDCAITGWMAHYGLRVLRIGLGIVFLWFGALKFFPGLSPEEDLVRHTVYFVDPDWFIPLLAVWECLIGVGLLLGKFLRATLLLLYILLPGTVLPLILSPSVVWKSLPFGLTLEGQYIIKNIVLIGAGLVIGGTVRGGKLHPEPPS